MGKKCNCGFCQQYRKHKKIIGVIKNEGVKQYVEELFDDLWHTKADLDYEEATHQGLRIKTGQMCGLGEAIDLIQGQKNE